MIYIRQISYLTQSSTVRYVSHESEAQTVVEIIVTAMSVVVRVERNCLAQLHSVICYFKQYSIVELDILCKFMLLERFLYHFFKTQKELYRIFYVSLQHKLPT